MEGIGLIGLIIIIMSLLFMTGCTELEKMMWEDLEVNFSEEESFPLHPFVRGMLLNEKCEQVAKHDWGMKNPFCRMMIGNKCFCNEIISNQCDEWLEKNMSRKCLRYEYSWDEIKKMERTISFELNQEAIDSVD